MKRVVLIVLAIAILAMPALAQEQTGKLQGKVATGDEKVVTGAKVMISSKNLIRPLSTKTDEKGRFRFPKLPIGEYTIKVTADQYKTFEQAGIVIRIGSSVTINPVMEVGAFEEVITISGETPIIDVESTDVGEVITQELMSKLPTPRFASEMFAMTPGNIGGDTVTLGGSSRGNSYKLDGIDVSDPQTHTVWVFVNMESIEEMEVLPIAGATADIGGFTGASLNMVTKSGGNEFSGGLTYYYFDEGFTERSIDDDDLYANTLRETENNEWTVFLGGPVVKDQLWFFANYGNRERFRQYGDDDEFPLSYEYRNNMVKLSGALSDNITWGGTWHYDNYLRERRGSDYNVSPEATVNQEGPNKSVAVHMDWAIDDNNMLEVKFHGWDGYFALLDNGEGPAFYDYQLDLNYGAAGYDYRADRQRMQFTANYTHYNDDFHGSHSLKAGFEFGRNEVIENDEYDYQEIWMGQLDWRYFYEDYYYEAVTLTPTFYATDSWTVNDRLHLNLGLRYEMQTLDSPDFTTPTGQNISGNGDVHTFHNLAPRFGFTYKLIEDGSLLLRGSAGRYYEAIVSGQLDMFIPNPSVEQYSYYDDGWVIYREVPFSDPDLYTLDDDLTQTYTDAVTIGFEYDLGYGVGIGVDYMWRTTKNFILNKETGHTWTPIEVVGEGGTTLTLYERGGESQLFVTNSDDDLYADYSALILRATKRYSNNWQLAASVTISELSGNAAAMAGSTAGQTNGGLDFYEEPNNQINREGLLGGHRPIIVKVNGTYTFPWDISLSTIAFYHSGERWTAEDYFEFGNESYDVLAEARGSRALDAVYNVDLRLEKSFMLEKISAQFFVDVYNLFNDDAVTGVENALYRSNFGEPIEATEGRRYQIGTRISF